MFLLTWYPAVSLSSSVIPVIITFVPFTVIVFSFASPVTDTDIFPVISVRVTLYTFSLCFVTVTVASAPLTVIIPISSVNVYPVFACT